MSTPEFIQPRPFGGNPPPPPQVPKRDPGHPFLWLLVVIAAIGVVGGAAILFLKPPEKEQPSEAVSPPRMGPLAASASDSPHPKPTPSAPPPAVSPLPGKTVPNPSSPPADNAKVEPQTLSPPTPSSEASGMSAKELEEARRGADDAMSDLLDIRRKVEAMQPEVWGGAAWSNAVAEAKSGDTAYMAKDFEEAARKFRVAVRAMEDVEEAAPLAFDSLLHEALDAVLRGDGRAATRLSRAALAIRPGDAGADKLLNRARVAEDVFRQMKEGASSEEAGHVEMAYAAYAEAQRLDPEFPGVAQAYERMRGQIGMAVLKKLMSSGLAAYREGQFDDARQKFLEAKRMRPDMPEIQDALRLVEDAIRLRRLDGLRNAAETEMAAENFESALKKYNEALAIDPSVVFAKEGRARSIEGIRLTRQLDAYLAQSESLYKDATLREARAFLNEAQAFAAAGEKLKARIDALAKALLMAETPIEVKLLSDGKTDVLLLRNGMLGRFEEKSLSLKPGNYTATGSRIGYRDVRVEIRVRPGGDLQAIPVLCKEKI